MGLTTTKFVYEKPPCNLSFGHATKQTRKKQAISQPRKPKQTKANKTKPTNTEPYRSQAKPTNKQTDKRTNKRKKQTNKQTNKQTDKQTNQITT